MTRGGFGDLGGLMKQAQQMMKQREKVLSESTEMAIYMW